MVGKTTHENVSGKKGLARTTTRKNWARWEKHPRASDIGAGGWMGRVCRINWTSSLYSPLMRNFTFNCTKYPLRDLIDLCFCNISFFTFFFVVWLHKFNFYYFFAYFFIPFLFWFIFYVDGWNELKTRWVKIKLFSSVLYFF